MAAKFNYLYCYTLVFLSLRCLHTGNGIAVKCRVPETNVHVGQSVMLDYIFENTNGVIQQDIIVDRHSIFGEKMNPEVVLDCPWIGNHQCVHAHGYRLVNLNSSNLVIEILNIKTYHRGSYICQIVPSELGKEGACIINVEDRERTSTDINGKEVGSEKESSSGKLIDEFTILIIVIGVPIIVTLMTASFIFFMCTRKQSYESVNSGITAERGGFQHTAR